MSRKADLFKKQFYLTVKLVVLGMSIALLGFHLGAGSVNALVMVGLVITTIAPLLSFYLVLRKIKSSNY